MKRYLITYIYDGDFRIWPIQADNLKQALEHFIKLDLEQDEIYSITRAA